MKKTFIYLSIFLASASNAQQLSIFESSRIAYLNKTIDEINDGPKKLKYSEIQGTPYYYANFVSAKAGDSSVMIPIRYNPFLDTLEILDNSTGDVYELPQDSTYPKFTFEKTNEKLVLVNTNDEYSGYFFELAGGKNRLLRKNIVKFKKEIPAPNSLLPSTPAKFEKQKPIYFIKTENNNIIKLTKNSNDLLNALPEDKKDATKDFIKTNKIKLNEELDLIKLVTFLNK